MAEINPICEDATKADLPDADLSGVPRMWMAGFTFGPFCVGYPGRTQGFDSLDLPPSSLLQGIVHFKMMSISLI